MQIEKVNPGIHTNAKRVVDESFPDKEKEIVYYWANEWYVTNAECLDLGQSSYRYFLIKPTAAYEEALSLFREVVVVLSPYQMFEPRTLEAFDEIYKIFIANRLERICYVLISGDDNIVPHLKECLSNQETQIVVPFTYNSFRENRANPNFIRNRFREFFYSRDLFDFSEPLKKDYYFFGRSDLTISIIEKHNANQNFGLFGLRKAGKTSIIYDIMRKLSSKDSIGVLIDCQNTSFNFRRWNQALYYVASKVYETASQEVDFAEEQFSETNAAQLFEKLLSTLSSRLSKKILLLFDEIENISFGKSGVPHWCDGLDFVYFWQSIRSAFHQTTNVFTFCIFGTNPKCIEVPSIQGKDNPIFNIFQPYYTPGFNLEQTREMVRKLGRLMGMKFDERVYARLLEDYGGHPFLIRQVCSAIARAYPSRPVEIDRTKYMVVRDKFNKENDYFDMLLDVLKQFYSEEYEMLKFLAVGDIDNFKYFADQDYSMVKHLVGYGIIREVDSTYDFQIDALKEHILRQQGVQTIIKKPEDKWAYICTQRNKVEVDLRKMVKTVLRIEYQTEGAAKDAVVKTIYGGDSKKYSTFSYADLFDSRKATIFLKHLQTLIKCNWDYFKGFWTDQEYLLNAMAILNKEGRFDAHATVPKDDEMVIIDSALNVLRNGINKYQESID